MNTTAFLDQALRNADARRDTHLGRVLLSPKHAGQGAARWTWRPGAHRAGWWQQR